MCLLRRTLPVLVVCGWFGGTIAAQEKFTTDLIPRAVLFGNPDRADPQISPDGKQLGYLAPVNGVLNVWIRTLGKTDDRSVTADKHRGIRNFLWQYDNQHILYVPDVGGDENWRLHQTDTVSKPRHPGCFFR
jgi:Tol biopolymer transport system component